MSVKHMPPIGWYIVLQALRELRECEGVGGRQWKEGKIYGERGVGWLSSWESTGQRGRPEWAEPGGQSRAGRAGVSRAGRA